MGEVHSFNEKEIKAKENSVAKIVNSLIPIRCKQFECANCEKDEYGWPECQIDIRPFMVSFVDADPNRKECPHFKKLRQGPNGLDRKDR